MLQPLPHCSVARLGATTRRTLQHLSRCLRLLRLKGRQSSPARSEEQVVVVLLLQLRLLELREECWARPLAAELARGPQWGVFCEPHRLPSQGRCPWQLLFERWLRSRQLLRRIRCVRPLKESGPSAPQDPALHHPSSHAEICRPGFHCSWPVCHVLFHSCHRVVRTD